MIAGGLADDFARELEQLRRDRGMTWQGLADASGVSKTYLRDLATARGNQGLPSERVVQRIAAALEVEPDHFRITRARVVLASPKAIDAVYARLKPKAAA